MLNETAQMTLACMISIGLMMDIMRWLDDLEHPTLIYKLIDPINILSLYVAMIFSSSWMVICVSHYCKASL